MRTIHRLLHTVYGIPDGFVLNSGDVASAPPDSPAIAADLRRLIHAMKAEAFDLDRRSVDYGRLSASPTYEDYRRCARQLRVFDLGVLSGREEQLAFWLNLYNALIVDAVIQFDVSRSVNEVRGFFWRAAYSMSGQRFSANDIEFGILRANAPHPAIPGAHFVGTDPRLRFSLTRRDPRIHFALTCASTSCPPIDVYDAEQIDRQLDMAARSFINGGGVEIDRARGEVRLSRIFQWYAPDFGAAWLALGDRTPLLKHIAEYLARDDDRDFLLRTRPSVRFVPYDWSLNHAAA